MKTLLIVLAIAVAVVGLMMAALGIKILFRKEKEFKRPCANADHTTGRCACIITAAYRTGGRSMDICATPV